MPISMFQSDRFRVSSAGAIVALVFSIVCQLPSSAQDGAPAADWVSSGSSSGSGTSSTTNSAAGPVTSSAPASKKRVSRGNPPSSSWMPGENDPSVRAALLCIHGLGLHNETYEPFGREMAKRGIATYALDMRGFGSYRQAKGHEEVDFDGCLDDLYRSLRSIRRAQPGKQVFLLGESMGGAIVLHAAAQRPDLIDGVVSCVPAGDRYKQGKTSLKVALQFLKDRHKQINVGEDVVNQATEKPELRAAWISDPLARMALSPKELLQFQQFMNANHDCCKTIKDKPVLVVYGQQDKLVKPEGTEELFRELSSDDKELFPVSSAEHLIFEENQFNSEVIDKVDSWMNAHIRESKVASIKKTE